MTSDGIGATAPRNGLRPAMARLGGILLLAGALWAALWFYVAGALEDGIARWAEQRQARGWAVTWRSLDIAGFPFLWEARLGGARAVRTGPAPSWFWQPPDRLVLRYRPWMPRRVEMTAPGLHRLGPDASAALRLDATAADGRMELDAEGRAARIEIALAGASLAYGETPPARIARLDAILAAPPAALPAPRPTDATATQAHLRPGFHLSGSLAGLVLPEGAKPVLGRDIARAALDVTVMGRIEPGPLLESLTLWRDDGGTAEIARVAIDWGPLAVDADGTLALDEALQPQAALSARITGHAQTVDALVRAGLIPPNAAFVTKLALSALAKTPEGGGPSRIDVPITIQERRLYVGPVALFTVPMIDWSAR